MKNINDKNRLSISNIILDDQGGSQITICYKICPTLRREAHGHMPLITTNNRADTGKNKNSICFENGIWCAGFLPDQGYKARGVGYEVEISPTLRCGFVPGVIIYGQSKNSKSVGYSKQTCSHD